MDKPKYVRVESPLAAMHDPRTNTIYYSNEVTRLHEYRHHLQNHSASWVFLDMCNQYTIPMAVAFLIGNNRIWAGYCAILWCLILLGKEADAWIYALTHESDVA